MKDLLDALEKAKDAEAELNSVCYDLQDRIRNLDDFVSGLVESIKEDKLHLYKVNNIREDLRNVNDTILLLLNNLDIATAIPTDTTGSSYIPFG